MAIKTVINRACKLLITSSDDGAIMEDSPGYQENGHKETVDENQAVHDVTFEEVGPVSEEVPGIIENHEVKIDEPEGESEEETEPADNNQPEMEF